MITFEHTEVNGFEAAFRGMRNPMDSWERSDSRLGSADGTGARFQIGEADMKLAYNLIRGGTEHAKFMRQIMCWVDITAPRLWWTEFDTYRFGVEKNSCSTMHRIMAKPLTEDDFGMRVDGETVAKLNRYREAYEASKSDAEKQSYKRYLIDNLPQSYRQKRTVMMSYQAIRAMFKQREGHFLKEWQDFRNWAATLPESWMITL